MAKKEFEGNMMIGAKIVGQLVNAVIDAGGSEGDVRQIETNSKLRKQIAELVVRGKKVVVSLQRDMAKEGWTLLENVLFDGKSFTPDIVEFLKPGESYVNGDVMRSRAKELNANLGQAHAEYLLEHQEMISKEYRQFYLVFPGTVWRDRCGGRYVPYLSWNGVRWFLYFHWFGAGWNFLARLVLSGKS